MDNIAIRDAFGEALKKLGGVNDKVVALDADVGGSTKSAVFGKEYSDRYFNVGISEMNMVSMAAGLATDGYIPFANTFAVFLTTRGADPIQALISYDKLNVKLAGTYCGLSDSYDGASHQAITDIALMRAIPNMTVISVSDAVETEKAVFAAAEYEGPVYIRMGRLDVETIFDEENYDFQIGIANTVREGNDVTIAATGLMTYEAIKAADILVQEGISVRVINVGTIKPLDGETILKAAQETKFIITAEEHSVIGGLGSAVSEFLSEVHPTKVKKLGIYDKFGQSGKANELLEKYELTAAKLVSMVKENM